MLDSQKINSSIYHTAKIQQFYMSEYHDVTTPPVTKSMINENSGSDRISAQPILSAPEFGGKPISMIAQRAPDHMRDAAKSISDRIEPPRIKKWETVTHNHLPDAPATN
jgi:hypothetical protein